MKSYVLIAVGVFLMGAEKPSALGMSKAWAGMSMKKKGASAAVLTLSALLSAKALYTMAKNTMAKRRASPEFKARSVKKILNDLVEKAKNTVANMGEIFNMEQFLALEKQMVNGQVKILEHLSKIDLGDNYRNGSDDISMDFLYLVGKVMGKDKLFNLEALGGDFLNKPYNSVGIMQVLLKNYVVNSVLDVKTPPRAMLDLIHALDAPLAKSSYWHNLFHQDEDKGKDAETLFRQRMAVFNASKEWDTLFLKLFGYFRDENDFFKEINNLSAAHQNRLSAFLKNPGVSTYVPKSSLSKLADIASLNSRELGKVFLDAIENFIYTRYYYDVMKESHDATAMKKALETFLTLAKDKRSSAYDTALRVLQASLDQKLSAEKSQGQKSLLTAENQNQGGLSKKIN